MTEFEPKCVYCGSESLDQLNSRLYQCKWCSELNIFQDMLYAYGV